MCQFIVSAHKSVKARWTESRCRNVRRETSCVPQRRLADRRASTHARPTAAIMETIWTHFDWFFLKWPVVVFQTSRGVLRFAFCVLKGKTCGWFRAKKDTLRLWKPFFLRGETQRERMQSGSDGRSHSHHCHLPFPNLCRHFFGVPVIHVSIIILSNPHREGDTRCMWQLELHSLPQRDDFFYPRVYLRVSTSMHQCEKRSCALTHKTALLISMLSVKKNKTQKSTLDVFMCTLKMCSYFTNLKNGENEAKCLHSV